MRVSKWPVQEALRRLSGSAYMYSRQFFYQLAVWSRHEFNSHCPTRRDATKLSGRAMRKPITLNPNPNREVDVRNGSFRGSRSPAGEEKMPGRGALITIAWPSAGSGVDGRRGAPQDRSTLSSRPCPPAAAADHGATRFVPWPVFNNIARVCARPASTGGEDKRRRERNAPIRLCQIRRI